MSTHTPGPWADVGLVIMHSGNKVADLRECDGDRKANASLLAAAPDLLAALDTLRAAVAAYEDDPDIDHGKALADAAIAKARGG